MKTFQFCRYKGSRQSYFLFQREKKISNKKLILNKSHFIMILSDCLSVSFLFVSFSVSVLSLSFCFFKKVLLPYPWVGNPLKFKSRKGKRNFKAKFFYYLKAKCQKKKEMIPTFPLESFLPKWDLFDLKKRSLIHSNVVLKF